MVGNGDVAAALERIAGLLEIRGDSVFKVRAYRTATAQIENLSEPLAEILAAGNLRELPGFGEAIVAKVEELLSTEEFGAAWQYFTGSQAHNVRLRALAQRQGLTLNEYGVHRVDCGGRVAGETEEDVYACLGLRWIPPDQREDRGELEVARLTEPHMATQEV